MNFPDQLRNHLLQLFRKAYKVDKGLDFLEVGVGGACVFGLIYCKYEDGSEDAIRASLWAPNYMGEIKPKTRELLLAVFEYMDLFNGNGNADLPMIRAITAQEIEAEKRKRKGK